MSETTWYYLDADRKPNGPVAVEVIRQLLRDGRIVDTTLVWRDGLSDWRPVRQLATELGIAPESSSPPSGSAGVGAGATHTQQASTGRPTAAHGATGDVVPAGFLRRWAALFLDSLILAIPLSVVSAIVAIPFGIFAGGRDSGEPIMPALYYLLYFIAAPLYYAGQESSVHQATLGKRALGIKVTDNDGRRIGFSHALGRWFATSLSYLTFCFGFLMAAFTERKRALHDMVAGTLVVDQWAYSEFPERQQRGLSGCLIAFLIGLLVVPFVLAVVAAIAVSQFQDYTVRAQVSEGTSLAAGVKTAVSEYRISNDAFPTSNAAAGLAAPASIAGSYVSRVEVGSVPGEITVMFSASPPQHANKAIDGKSIVFSPTESNGVVEWRCHSDNLKQKFCSKTCECQR